MLKSSGRVSEAVQKYGKRIVALHRRRGAQAMGCFSVILGFVLLIVGILLLLGGFLGTALAVCVAAFRGLMEALAALLRVLF